MKATLEFNLPEENYSFVSSQRGEMYRCAIMEFDQRLRRLIEEMPTRDLELVLRLWKEAMSGLEIY